MRFILDSNSLLTNLCTYLSYTMKNTFLFLFVILAIPAAKAGGSQVNLQGQKQQGMGHVATAFTQGAENLFFNPGSISFLSEKTMISFGVNGIFSGVAFQGLNESQVYRNEPGVSTPFNLYVTHKLSDRFAAGIGIYIPFGSTLNWEEEWKGRYIVQKVELRTFYIQPTISYKVNEKLGIGIGGVIGVGSLSLEKDIPVSATSGERAYVVIEGQDVSYGFNLGLYYELNDKLHLGFDYRSGVEFDVKGGDANFFVPNALADKFPAKNTFDASLPLPSTTTLGLKYKVSEKLSLGMDLSMVGWGVYDELNIDFETNTESLEDLKSIKDYSNVFIIRVGGEYQYNEKIIGRFGAYFDQTPVSDMYFSPETPDMNKIGLCTGFSYQFSSRSSLDMSYIFLTGAERDIKNIEEGFQGTVKSIGHIPGIGYSYKF
jgi:long-chain fatty acid transport protein